MGCSSSIIFLPAGLRLAQACWYFFTQWSKNGFFARRHVALINVKFGTGKRNAGPLPHAEFHVYRAKNVGIQPPKLSKFEFLAEICTSGATTRLQYFYD